MRRAWNMARHGARRFGGKPRDYLAIAMKLAWREIRAPIIAAIETVTGKVAAFVAPIVRFVRRVVSNFAKVYDNDVTRVNPVAQQTSGWSGSARAQSPVQNRRA